MLNNGTITANLPAADLGRARAFYADKLGLTPSQELEGVMLVYSTAGGSPFSIYQTDYAGQAGHTLAQWHVEPPRVCRRLHLLGRMELCRGDRGTTRRSYGIVLSGWSRRSGRSMRLSGRPLSRLPRNLGSGLRKLSTTG